MPNLIVPIVEGQSEVESARPLFQRILWSADVYDVDVAKPFRVKRNKVVRNGELENAVTQAIRTREDAGAVLVLLDADDDCPSELGPALFERAASATDLPVAVVLAEKEFEGWFLGAKESLRGTCGIREDATPPSAPEDIRGAKGRLTANMDGDRGYIEVDDQPALVSVLDLDLAESRCRSFAKLRQDLARLVDEIRARES